MATYTICDSCGEDGIDFLKIKTVELHPRDGEEMPTYYDVCFVCAKKMEIRVDGTHLPRFKSENEEAAA